MNTFCNDLDQRVISPAFAGAQLEGVALPTSAGNTQLAAIEPQPIVPPSLETLQATVRGTAETHTLKQSGSTPRPATILSAKADVISELGEVKPGVAAHPKGLPRLDWAKPCPKQEVKPAALNPNFRLPAGGSPPTSPAANANSAAGLSYCGWCNPKHALAADGSTSTGLCAACLEKMRQMYGRRSSSALPTERTIIA